MKIMYVDTPLAERIAELSGGDKYEHKKTIYDVVDNRPVFKDGLASGELWELVIEYNYTYFVAQYGRIGDLYNFESNEAGRVEFVPMVREIQVRHSYVAPQDATDLFDPKEVSEVTKQLSAGAAYIRINDDYALVSKIVNRKGETKVEVEVYKEKGIMETKDIVNMEAFLKVMEKTHVVDYSIIFDVKSKMPKMKMKITIGIEKRDWQQTSLFDQNKDPEKLEVITLIDDEEIQG